MNATLRSRHRLFTTVLAVVVPVGLALALAARPSQPTMERLPVSDGNVDAFTVALGQPEQVAVEGATLGMTLLTTSPKPAAYAVRIQPDSGRGVRGPDVLVYWSADSAGDDARLPDGAFLLGTLAGGQTRTLPLPASAGPGVGRVLFYSLAHQRLYDRAWTLPGAK
jgi:hypothetical protein